MSHQPMGAANKAGASTYHSTAVQMLAEAAAARKEAHQRWPKYKADKRQQRRAAAMRLDYTRLSSSASWASKAGGVANTAAASSTSSFRCTASQWCGREVKLVEALATLKL
mmetsp:Transcript_20557/g.61866  ORF Transcript_20557/g.61866 Transcript_20557/m.61866 type:complete len:111 (+) Transcript_20557:573-905(+)